MKTEYLPNALQAQVANLPASMPARNATRIALQAGKALGGLS